MKLKGEEKEGQKIGEGAWKRKRAVCREKQSGKLDNEGKKEKWEEQKTRETL